MNKKPKILFIGPLPPPFSGPELSMQQLLNSELLNASFEIEFLRTNFRADNTNKGKFGGAMILNFYIFFWNLLIKLMKFKPACVYYPITPTQIGWLGRDVWAILLSKIFGAKVIIHLRGSHFKLNFTQFNWFAKKIIGYGLQRVSFAIVQAKYLRDQFAPYIKEENVFVLYQAMDINEFPIGTPPQIEAGKILVIGHMTKAKGYTDILKIIPEIASEFPFIKFYFAGNIRKGERGVFFNQFTGAKIEYEDPFNAENELKESPYSKNYVNLGIISGSEKLKHFQTTDIFLSASYSEGFSRSLLEAMSTGKPIIYTPVGAHREVFDDSNGDRFEPGNLDQLINVLRIMLNNDKRQLIGKFNRDYVNSNFSLDKIVNNFREIINKTLTK